MPFWPFSRKEKPPPPPPPARVAGVIPCAGASTRMGAPKALMDAGGRSFVSAVIGALVGGGCDPVLVILSDGQGEVDRKARAAGALTVVNPDPGEGPITSLRIALAALEGAVEGVALLPVDHPRVRPETTQALVDAFLGGTAPLVIPVHQGQRGHPTLFRRTLFAELRDPGLEGGARTVVHAHLEEAQLVPVDDPGVLDDIDTPDAYRQAFAGGLGAAAATERTLAAVEGGGSAVCVLVLGTSVEGHAGRRLLLVRNDDGTEEVTGHLGDPTLDEAAVVEARAALDDPRRGDGAAHVDFGAATADAAPTPTAELYLEVRRPVRDLVIVGAGHIAQPLSRMGALLGYRVIVVDDRPAFATVERFPDAERVVRADFSDPFADVALHPRSHVLLVTRGHKYDYECLIRLLRMDPLPAYVGMIGSRRRVRATYAQLLDEGIPRERLGVVHAPVGLDLGAETPEEIAVAVAAELVLVHRGGTGTPLKDVERVAERFFTEAPSDPGSP